MPMAAQFGLKSSVKSRKLSTPGESDALCRTNIAILHLTAGCSNGRNGTAGEFGKFIDDERCKWGEAIRAAGLKGE